MIHLCDWEPTTELENETNIIFLSVQCNIYEVSASLITPPNGVILSNISSWELGVILNNLWKHKNNYISNLHVIRSKHHQE
jgi:hypothetical protein